MMTSLGVVLWRDEAYEEQEIAVGRADFESLDQHPVAGGLVELRQRRDHGRRSYGTSNGEQGLL